MAAAAAKFMCMAAGTSCDIAATYAQNLILFEIYVII
jgi:hypothetical protein